MFKAAIKVLGKIIISGILALVILTSFCFFYYNIPVHSTNRDGSTDYKWETYAFYSHGTEGFAWGKTNNEGFYNLFDYDNDIKIDILMMGSSHMEAGNVVMDQSTASKLNALLESETVYNIGVSGHTFLICANNFRAALNKYQPTNYVVMETSSISFSDEAIALAIKEETPEIPSNDGGIIGLLQKNPYIRLVYHQIQNFIKLQAEDIEDAGDPEIFVKSDTVADENLYYDLFQKMSVLAEEYGAKVIIAYHPSTDISPDGAICLDTDPSALAQFKQSCDANGILFLDMSSRFKEEYESAYILPYGFSNTPVGSGHMNKYGHAMMADELYKLILEDEQ